MRSVVSALFISLDGVTESPNEWQFDVFNDELMSAMSSSISAQDAVLLGRVTYQEWASYWPTSSDEPYASFINGTPKFVFSSTLRAVDEWQNSTLISGDAAEAVRALKQQPGKNIGVQGSPTLVRWLLEAELLDELTLMIHPVVTGNGKRLFNEGGALKKMRLVNSTTTATGVVLLTYQPV